ncbi:AAA family ATPase [uncultured Ferrimonas sp.]|uniref:AAA family ATPase n=1 Tax=uncultured Ferrimonas sp. TaxID=432640 RepID=UPI0026381797|nr:AAA family ATPase [uncultured Ferrimonas sp.]
MPRYTKQKLKTIDVTKLKGIENLQGVSFNPHNVTAILGANCIGKSSLLHALASCYQPQDGELSEDHRISEYLKPNPHALWRGTEYKITYEYRDRGGSEEIIPDDKVFSKNSDRWKPRYDRRPYRSVFYIGIHTTLPLLEYINFIKNKSAVGSQRIRYTTEEQTSEIFQAVRQKASYIFNRNYSNIYTHEISGWSEMLFGLACDNMTYSQISMGAGEQRVLKILTTVFRAPEYALILIDELDLLLHDDAFQRIVEVIRDRASQKNIQVVFTTHRESVLRNPQHLNIRYLKKVGSDTKVLNQVTPDALLQLTGTLDKSLTVYVEDGLSERIVKKVSQSINISKHIKVVQFGAAQNIFVMAGSTAIEHPEKDAVFVLDGDVYRGSSDKETQMNSAITGRSEVARNQRERALEMIFQYNIPESLNPEQYIKESIVKLTAEQVPPHLKEIYTALSNVHAVLDKHNYINAIMHYYDEPQNIIIKDVVDLFSLTPQWLSFISNVKAELERKAEQLALGIEESQLEVQVEL